MGNPAVKQPDLLDLLDPPTANTTVSRATRAAHAATWVRKPAWEPFEFTGDDPRLVPRPDWVVPAELSLPTDDPDWQPGRG